MFPTITQWFSLILFGSAVWWSGEHKTIVQWAAVIICVAQCLNDSLRRIELRFRKEEQQRRLHCSRLDNCEIEFPWNDIHSNTDKEESSRRKFSMKSVTLSNRSWIPFFDLDGRRRGTLEFERQKWRELQQQLAILRSVRANRMSSSQQEAHSNPPMKESVSAAKANGDPTFPWKPNNKSNSLLSRIRPVLHSKDRRKEKWDVERKRWRELQQQLGTLRSIRAERAVAGTQWESLSEEPKLVDTTRSFPWNEETSTTRSPTAWYLSCIPTLDLQIYNWVSWVSNSEFRRTLQWDTEMRKWRELQQQLGTLHSVRASRSVAGTQWQSPSGDGVAPDTMKSFAWNEVESTNCEASEWLVHSYFVGFNSWIQYILNSEYRRTLKWDKERRRWRDLQQQLGTLRSIRAEREKQGDHWVSNDFDLTERRQCFPWTETTRPNDSKWLETFLEHFGIQKYKQQKWDYEREKWRELQQQLGMLRSLRAKKEKERRDCV